jgi:hypothetical protein
MKTEDILSVEESGDNCINLVRDRLFWQAWNKSAFLFATHIKNYQVHKRFVKKVSQEVAWLGFPSSALSNIKRIAIEKGFTFEQKSQDHIFIGKVPQPSGYEKWWLEAVKAKVSKTTDNISKSLNSEHRLLPAYKVAYSLCLHICRATEKMPKEFRYDLGVRLRGYAVDLSENLHLMANNIKAAGMENKIQECAVIAHKLRIDSRILKDIHQISIKQWGFINQQLEDFLNLLRAEFCNTNARIAKATQSQSSETLPPDKHHLQSSESIGIGL